MVASNTANNLNMQGSRQSWDIIGGNNQYSKLGFRTSTTSKASSMALVTLLPAAICSPRLLFYICPNIILVFLFHTLWRRFHIIQDGHFPSKLSSFKQKARQGT